MGKSSIFFFYLCSGMTKYYSMSQSCTNIYYYILGERYKLWINTNASANANSHNTNIYYYILGERYKLWINTNAGANANSHNTNSLYITIYNIALWIMETRALMPESKLPFLLKKVAYLTGITCKSVCLAQLYCR